MDLSEFVDIKHLISEGQRISEDQAANLYLKAPVNTLMELAQIVRSRYHKKNEATYLIMAIINYTNICVAKCDYCSFYKLPHQEGTYLLTLPEIFKKVDKVIALGGTFVGFNGGFHPKLGIPHYAKVFNSVRQRYGNSIDFYGMTVAEFIFASKVSKMSYKTAAKILKDNGSQWVPGGGAEVLDNGFRKRHSPGKFTVEEFFLAQQALLESGLGSTATMVIGFDETLDQRLNHLKALRSFQDSSGGALPSFLCWTYKPWNNALGGKEIATEEYLRWLAVCRIYLDNIKHIRTSVLTQNERALEGLLYGANDFDLPIEDEVTEKAGAHIDLNFDSVLDHAHKLSYTTHHRAPFAVDKPFQAPPEPHLMEPVNHPSEYKIFP